MEKVLLTMIVAFAGGIIGIKLKVPAGAMIGSMFAVAIYNLITDKAFVPTNYKLVAQMVVGGIIGLKFTKESIFELKELILPILIITIGHVLICVILGYILYKFTDVDIGTALFSTAPGGITDLSIVAEAYDGVDVRHVVVLHMFRLITVITCLPIIIKYIMDKIP